MIQHSSLLEEAVRFGHSMRTVVDIYKGSERVYADAPLVSGTVASDRTANVRWSASIVLGLYPWDSLPLLDTAESTFRVYRGVTTLGYEEMLPMGVYRVNEQKRASDGKVALTGSGFESYVIDDRFLVPRQPPYGQSTIQAIADLIGESMPTVRRVLAMNTYDKPVTMTAAWPRDRIDALLALADSIRAEVFADNSGTWVLKDNPTLQLAAPVYTVDSGEAGVLISEDEGDTRDGVYNAVSVTGRSNEDGQPPVWGWARDDNPASKTYWGGPFGHKPRFYTNDGIATAEDCVRIATAQLQQALTANQSFSFTSAAVCFLEAGDVVHVKHADGTAKDYLLNTTSLDLSPAGTLQAGTFRVRADLGSDS